MCRICEGEGCLNCERDPDNIGDFSQFGDDDFETEDYLCSRCNGGGCVKCED